MRGCDVSAWIAPYRPSHILAGEQALAAQPWRSADHDGRMIRLVGPGGAGKSTAGHLLALRLDVPFRDLDVRFVERFGGIDEFIAAHGYQAYARERRGVLLRPRRRA